MDYSNAMQPAQPQPPMLQPAESTQAAQLRAEVDLQIATAKRYPRDVNAALNRILTIATLDEETAADCFYSLRRGQGQPIEGISVRLAEIIAGAWGNLRVQTLITANDGRAITARALCHDLETNLAVIIDVQRGILDRAGRTYSQDMQVVTGNAAMAIAFRNAVLKVVPKAVTNRIVRTIRDVAAGRVRNMGEARRAMVEYFAELGVAQPQILEYLGVRALAEVDAAMVMQLRGLANALREGTATLESTFPDAAGRAQRLSEEKAAALMAKANEAQQRVKAAMRDAGGGQASGEGQGNENQQDGRKE